MVIPHTEEMNKARQWKEGSNNKRGYAEVHFEDAWLAIWGDQSRQRTRKICMHEEGVSASGTSGTIWDWR